MNKKMLALSLLVMATLQSCNKYDDLPVRNPDFMPMKVGNYWIYEFYRIDTNGVETRLDQTDSCYIVKDTLINGVLYYVQIAHPNQFAQDLKMTAMAWEDTTCLRDSSGYLVSNIGFIYFSRDNFTDTIRTDTISNLTWYVCKMTGKDSVISLPSGDFVTRSMRRTFYPLIPDYPWGTRHFYNVYAANVGQIIYQYGFYSQPNYYEARLIRWHVE